jgi:hypothetical protein
MPRGSARNLGCYRLPCPPFGRVFPGFHPWRQE